MYHILFLQNKMLVVLKLGKKYHLKLYFSDKDKIKWFVNCVKGFRLATIWIVLIVIDWTVAP